MFSSVLERLGTFATPDLAVPGIETGARAGAGRRVRFLLNHNETATRLILPAGGHELISDTRVAGEIELGPGEVAVVREESASG